jgi:hypothetical protein
VPACLLLSHQNQALRVSEVKGKKTTQGRVEEENSLSHWAPGVAALTLSRDSKEC